MTKKPRVLEVKLGHDLGLQQQLVMTPQLQQAVNILKLSLPELETMVQNELAPRGSQKKVADTACKRSHAIARRSRPVPQARSCQLW